MKKTSTVSNPLLTVTRITKAFYLFAIVYGLSIIVFDSGNLITRDAVVDRWTLLSVFIGVNSLVWLASAQLRNNLNSKVILTSVLAIAILTLAGFTSYWERGMASTSTIFYVLPILVIATLQNRHAILATATLSATTYAYSAVKYFNDFFNEGFRVQLWGSLLMYIGVIYVCAWLIMVIIDLRKDSA